MISASLFGEVNQAVESGRFGRHYAALGGTGGLTAWRFTGLFTADPAGIALLPDTPASPWGPPSRP